jgi:signal transduction histidine kinase
MTTRWARTLAGGSFLASVLLSATTAVFLVQAWPRPVSHGIRFQRVPDRVGHRGRRGWGRPRLPPPVEPDRLDPGHDPEHAEDLRQETQNALEDLRDLARGIYPPLLADKGLPDAVEAQARKAALPVRVRSDGIGRYPQHVEAAVYFRSLGALQNVAKYAQASSVDVRFEERQDLGFEIRHDGVGDPPDPMRSGMANMRDRITALGGTFEIRSDPGHGTAVRGRVPLDGSPV